MVDSGIVGFRGRRIFGWRQPVIFFSAPIFPCRSDQGIQPIRAWRAAGAARHFNWGL